MLNPGLANVSVRIQWVPRPLPPPSTRFQAPQRALHVHGHAGKRRHRPSDRHGRDRGRGRSRRGRCLRGRPLRATRSLGTFMIRRPNLFWNSLACQTLYCFLYCITLLHHIVCNHLHDIRLSTASEILRYMRVFNTSDGRPVRSTGCVVIASVRPWAVEGAISYFEP